MDGVGGKTGEGGQHLGGAARRGEQHSVDAHPVEASHQRPHDGGLPRAGISVEDEHRVAWGVGRAETRQRGGQLNLLIGRLERHLLEHHFAESQYIHVSVFFSGAARPFRAGRRSFEAPLRAVLGVLDREAKGGQLVADEV